MNETCFLSRRICAIARGSHGNTGACESDGGSGNGKLIHHLCSPCCAVIMGVLKAAEHISEHRQLRIRLSYNFTGK
jgi:hypothetical protein